MFDLKRQLKMLGAAVAVVAVGAVFVSPAMGAVKFSSSTIKLTTTGITLNHNTESRTCTPEYELTGETFSNWAVVSGGDSYWKCNSSGSLEGAGMIDAAYDAVTGKYTVYLSTSTEYPRWTPWGWYNPTQFKGTWVNGSGATQSTIKVENQSIGIDQSDGKPILFTGTFTAKTGTGGLITLSH